MRRWSRVEWTSLGVAAALVVAGPRLPVRVVGVEGWASEGFAGLAAELAARPEPPTWEEVRRTMERRGCIDLRYALTVRSLFTDGSIDGFTYIHQPYRQPECAQEFLRYLRGGPDAAVWPGAGEPPWKAAAADDEPVASPLPR